MPTAVRERAHGHRFAAGERGRRGGGRPGSQETCHGRSPQALVERGRLMLSSHRILAGDDVAHARGRGSRTRMVTASRGFLAALAVLCALACVDPPQPAIGASISVNLRVEGSTRTLFEGKVATSPETIETALSGGPHPCNYAENGPPGGFASGGSQSGTPTTALHDAALAAGLSFDAEWFGSGAENGNPGDFFVSRVGSDVNQTEPPFDS